MPTEPNQPLPTTNQPATYANKVVGDLMGLGETAVETAAEAAAPFLAYPVIKQIWEALLHWIFVTLGGALGKLAGYVVLDIEEYQAIKTASDTLLALDAARTVGDQHAIQTASDAADDAAAALIHYYGSIQS